MKKILLLLFSLVFLCSGCSSNDDSSMANAEYFKFNVEDVELTVDPTGNTQLYYNSATITQNADVFLLQVDYGFTISSEHSHVLKIYFDKNGGTIKVEQNSSGLLQYYDYYNYENFPSNYFTVNIVSLDEVNKKIKLNFSGKLYLNKTNLNSESVDMSGDLYMSYRSFENPNYGITVNGIEQYCTANINSNVWTARKESPYSQFTSTDAYKIEPHFASNTIPGTYNFTPASTDNYVRFSKFNTATLTYDQYNVTGVVAHSYREFHGLTRYSFIGSFNFTAVNPNNPSDVIQVTEGTFRSYQQY